MKKRIKIYFNKQKIRFTTAFRILFGLKPHYFVCWIDRDNLVKLIKADSLGQGDYRDVTIKYTYHGLQPYNVFKLIEIMYNQNDEIDMVLMKAKWEADATDYNKNKD